MLKCVIFDMDGVILNSEPLYFSLETRIFKELGFALTLDEHRKFVGFSNTLMWQTLKDRFGLTQDIKELVEYERDRFHESLESDGFPGAVEGVIDLIQALSSKRIALAIASSSARRTIDKVCDVLNIRHHFGELVSGDDVPRGKPYPDIFIHTASLMKMQSDSILVIEDAHSGVRAAKSAGMKCAGYQNEASGNQDLSMADLVFHHFNELSPERLQFLFVN